MVTLNTYQASRLPWPRSGQTEARLRRWAGETLGLRWRLSHFAKCDSAQGMEARLSNNPARAARQSRPRVRLLVGFL